MTTMIVRFAEIALKGENRRDFVRQLATNIEHALGEATVTPQRDQLLVEVEPAAVEEARAKLARVFGVAWFAEVVRVENDLHAIREAAYEAAGHLLGEQTAFGVRARRSNKRLPFTSRDINREVGAYLQQKTGAPVDLDHPDVQVYVSAKRDGAYVYAQKIPGPGGLPVGASGRVLSLLSGGFDSIASSYLLAKRGARVDYLHFHVFPNRAGVMRTKMPDLWNRLSEYTLSRRVYLADYTPFQMGVLDLPMGLQRYELVTFRRLMVRVGEALAQRHGYSALALGDSLGQVASQTMENIVAVDGAVDIPIFRPLIGADKVEIVNLVTGIGLEETAAAAYKDCCSIIARHPATKANLGKIQAIEERIDVERVVEEIVESVEVIAPGEGQAEQPARYIVDRL